MEPNQNSNQSTIIKIIAAVAVLGLAGFAFAKMSSPAVTETPARVDNVPTENTAEPIATNSKYKNGTYTATGKYNSPAGEETVDVTLTINNDIVTAATFKGNATNPGSVMNQGLFKQGFEQYVVGKPIDSISLTVVNGSSLTPKGFKDALSKIKVEAQA